MSVFISIITVLLVLGILSAAHELGHFFVAKLMKVKAYEVSIFVGPALFKWRKNNVDYSIRCIPIGAYVRFNEVDNEGKPIESDDPTLLLNQPRWKRLIIALAGPFVNLILGILIFIVFFCATGYTSLDLGATDPGTQLYEQHYEVGDTVVALNGKRVFTYDELYISFNFINDVDPVELTLKSKETGEKYNITLTPVIKRQTMLGINRLKDLDPDTGGWVIAANWNEKSDLLQEGDILVSIDGRPMDDNISEYVSSKSENDTVAIEYIRDGQKMTGEVPLFAYDHTNYRGIILQEHSVRSVGEFFGAVGNAVKMPVSILRLTGLVISNAIGGKVEIYNVISGPVGVVNVVDTVVANENVNTGLKVSTLVMLAGMISVALTISNMLPLPGLDGAQVIILIVEMVIGRKLPQKAENAITIIGFFVLLGLVLLAFASDIAKIVFEGW
ncbi:MAG: RIP metalloprotease RseP [Clostridiales bacterium]|nr:RIP metalloprotease RseP [Clostridiales bacterium]